jgi:hypothetical protein
LLGQTSARLGLSFGLPWRDFICAEVCIGKIVSMRSQGYFDRSHFRDLPRPLSPPARPDSAERRRRSPGDCATLLYSSTRPQVPASAASP